MTSTRSALALVAGMGLVAACSAPADETTDQALSIHLESRFADLKQIKTDQLVRVAAGFATDKLNDTLVVAGNGVAFETPQVFALREETNALLPASAKVKSVEAIATGLATQFGERELPTEVNRLRQKRLSSGGAKYFVEGGFTIKAGIDHGWGFAVGGFAGGAGANLGFTAKTELSSRIVAATDSAGLEAMYTAPAKAVKEARGFVYPRSLDEIRKLGPGEMYSLRGAGKLGANFGLGVPILVANPAQGITYTLVVSAGVAGVLSGDVDVSVVRLEGDEVVVEVGIERASVESFSAALQGGWGVANLCGDGACLRPVQIGPARVDLQRLVEKAMAKRLNDTFQTRIAYATSSGSSRVSVSHMRFHLDRGDREETGRALEHALKADVRLAQAVYSRDLGEPNPAVTVDFDLVRSVTTSQRDFGATVFGLDIFHKRVVEKQGSFVVQTPDGAQAVLFDTLEKRGGWFQMDHGFKRTGLSALSTQGTGAAKSEANLFLQTVVGDSHMDDDIIIDNADALIGQLAGKEALVALDAYGNEMERTVWRECPVEETRGKNGTERRTWDEGCNVALLDRKAVKDPVTGELLTMAEARQRGLDALRGVLGAKGLPAEHAALVEKTGELRLVLQSVGIHGFDATSGPNVSFAFNLRLDDGALDRLSRVRPDAYKASVRAYLNAVSVKRGEVKTADDRAKWDISKYDRGVENLGKVFEARARDLQILAVTERDALPEALAGRRYVSHPVGVRFVVDRGDAEIYESAAMGALSHERAQAAVRLFDDLNREADRLPSFDLYSEHAAVYPLVGLVAPSQLEVGVDVKADTASSFWNSRERFQKVGFKSLSVSARGADVHTITGGMFDLNALLGP